MFGRKKRQQAHRFALVAAELYAFIVTELDPEPRPIEAYISSPELQFTAKIVGRLANTEILASSHETNEGERA